MDVIKFQLSDYEWHRVITIINGKKINKFVYEARLKDEVYEKTYEGDSYGDGIYPGWLYYELKGGNYWNCPELYNNRVYPEKLSAEPYIPYLSYTRLSQETRCDNCIRCNDRSDPKCMGVLGCACGDDGCGIYLVRITETENSVIWDDYFAFYHNTPNYFHFEFEKNQYYEEVEKLLELTLKIGEKEGLPVDIINNIKNSGGEIEQENNNYVQYPITLSKLMEQINAFSGRIQENIFDLACQGKWKNLDKAEDAIRSDWDLLRKTGDKNIDLLWEVIDKIEEVIKKIKD